MGTRNDLCEELQGEVKELRGNLVRTEKTVSNVQENQIQIRRQLDNISNALHKLHISRYARSPLERPLNLLSSNLILKRKALTSNRAFNISFNEDGEIELRNRGSSRG